MAHLAAEAGLPVEVDSAGTAGYHIGDRPDPRALEAAARRGIHLPSRARQFHRDDFARFDLILAMDRSNLADLRRSAPGPDAESRLHLLRQFDPTAEHDEVPDPYYGGPDGFDLVVDLVDAACRGLLDHLRVERGW